MKPNGRIPKPEAMKDFETDFKAEDNEDVENPGENAIAKSSFAGKNKKKIILKRKQISTK